MKNFRGSALAAGVGTPESVPHELLGSSLRFYLVFKHRNCFEIKEHRCLVLQCGELNILKNYQAEGNRVAFRFDNDPVLEKRFFNLIDQIDIVLNPIHKPMGNQGKLSKRRIILSEKGRAYFSTCNALTGDTLSLKQKSLQYATVDGKDYPETESAQYGRSYIIRKYEL